MALDNSGSTSSGAAIVQNTLVSGDTNQEWLVLPLNNGYCNLLCLTSGMALDNGGSTSNGGAIVQKTQTSGDTNQEWQLPVVPGQ
jgi:Ricin-type beta-trefoil lectin domain-like